MFMFISLLRLQTDAIDAAAIANLSCYESETRRPEIARGRCTVQRTDMDGAVFYRS